MGDMEKCGHLKGLQATSGAELWCPTCDEVLDYDGVERWVRESEKARDESYPSLEGDKFGEIVREERQREVYRRRRLLYVLRGIPRVPAKPEMILAVCDEASGSYECRIFYKEPKPPGCIERIVVEESCEEIQELKTHSDPVARLVAEKVWEFHRRRRALVGTDEHVPTRRVFYANEL